MPTRLARGLRLALAPAAILTFAAASGCTQTPTPPEVSHLAELPEPVLVRDAAKRIVGTWSVEHVDVIEPQGRSSLDAARELTLRHARHAADRTSDLLREHALQLVVTLGADGTLLLETSWTEDPARNTTQAGAWSIERSDELRLDGIPPGSQFPPDSHIIHLDNETAVLRADVGEGAGAFSKVIRLRRGVAEPFVQWAIHWNN